MNDLPQRDAATVEPNSRTTVASVPPEASETARVAAPFGRILGQREREVMSIVCEQDSASVQQVSDRLSTVLAYTTVMTTLDRLFKKGFLRRQKKDRAYIYSATLTSNEIETATRGRPRPALLLRFRRASRSADLLPRRCCAITTTPGCSISLRQKSAPRGRSTPRPNNKHQARSPEWLSLIRFVSSSWSP